MITRAHFGKIMGGIVGAYLLAGFIGVPWILEQKLPDMFKTYTGGILHVEDIDFNPITFNLDIESLQLLDPKGEKCLALKHVNINYEPHALLFGTVKLRNFSLVKPELFVQTEPDGSTNIAWLLGDYNQTATSSDATRETTLPRIALKHLRIEEGVIHYRDISKATPFEITLDPIDFKVVDIDTATLQSGDNRLRITSRINDGGFIALHSKLYALKPLRIGGSIDFDSGKLFTGWRYLQEMLSLEIADGKLHAHTDFYFDGDDINATRLENMALTLERLRIKPKDAYHDILHVEHIALEEGSLFPLAQKGHIGRFVIDGTDLYLKRFSEGAINWQHYVKVKIATEAHEGASKPWDVTLDRFEITRFKSSFDDEAIMPHQKLRLHDFNMTAIHISSRGGVALQRECLLS